MMPGKHWTVAEDTLLKEMLHKGYLPEWIVRHFPDRTPEAVMDRADRFEATTEANRAKATARNSEFLREALLDAQTAYANRAGINLEQAQAELMGGAPMTVIPGTERVYRGQMAERALAA